MWRSFDMRLAAVLGTASFLWAPPALITAHNFELSNAGVIVWTGIVIPLIGFTLLWLQRRRHISDSRCVLGSLISEWLWICGLGVPDRSWRARGS